MSDYQIQFFPCGNGDCSVIRVGDTTVVTDVNYRQDAQDPENSDCFDFGDHLRAACTISDGSLRASVFVLTHPDQDHLGGLGDLFHLGTPETREDDPEKGAPLILIDELWVSPYAVNPNDHDCKQKQAVYDEIQRRYSLMGTVAGDEQGNRLRIITADDEQTQGSVNGNNSLNYHILAPTEEEANIEDSGDPDNPTSANDSSLVIRWEVNHSGEIKHILLGGDATVEVWDRIWEDYQRDLSVLEWDILLAPHHCSRGAMGRKIGEDANGNSLYDYENNSLLALGQAKPGAFIVASAKPFDPDGSSPPSPDAKDRYLGILEGIDIINPEENFLHTEVHLNGDLPAPIEFSLDDGCLILEPATDQSPAILSTGAAAAAAGEYG